MNAGRSASPINVTSAAIASGSGAALRRAAVSSAGIDPADGAKNTSIGTSRNVGPRCGVSAVVAAACTAAAACVGSLTVPALLVIEATTGTWSISCSEPAPQRPSGARPPSTTSGVPLNQALVIADTPLVIPGPAVSAARPGRRVSL